MVTKYPFPTEGPPSKKSPDNNVNQICNEFIERSLHGFNKYGVTTERQDLNLDQWMQHLKEELMDAIVYLHRIQRERALDKMVDTNEQLGLYDNTMASGLSEIDITASDTITLNVQNYGAAMPVIDSSLFSDGDTITISVSGVDNEFKTGSRQTPSDR